MVIQLVWAQDRNGAIGRGGAIPWHVPEDMRHFREVTGAGPVVMGRKTWDSLPERFRPLPRRRNIVVTRTPELHFPGAEVATSVDEALTLADRNEPGKSDKTDKEGEVDERAQPISVIGGGQIYRIALPFVSLLRVTEIDVAIDDADAYAPAIDPALWQASTTSELLTSATGTKYSFTDYRRR